MGSKVPPKMPTLTPASSEIKLHRADSHRVPGPSPGPPERRDDALFLQRTLEVLDPLGVIPIGPECEPLHVLAGDLVGALPDLLDAQPLPGRPEDAVFPLAVACREHIGRRPLPQPPL